MASGYIDHNSKGWTLNSMNKLKQLVEDGGTEVKPEWQENLICVITGPTFDVAVYCHSQEVFKVLNQPDKILGWLTHPKAKELSGFKD
jgi:hypothetical protein